MATSKMVFENERTIFTVHRMMKKPDNLQKTRSISP